MQVSTANSVKVYNLSAGKSLPEWISERKRRTLLKTDIGELKPPGPARPSLHLSLLGLRRRIELIQDFTMPVASTRVKTSPDGQYILTTGDCVQGGVCNNNVHYIMRLLCLNPHCHNYCYLPQVCTSLEFVAMMFTSCQ